MKRLFFLISFAFLVGLPSAQAVDAFNSLNTEPPTLLSKTYTITKDYRDCMPPLCGGWWIKAVNQFDLQAMNTSERYEFTPHEESIYIESVDLSQVGLSASEEEEITVAMKNDIVVIKGRLVNNPTHLERHLERRDDAPPTLLADKLWTSYNDEPSSDGIYMNISSTGIVCITTPCPYYRSKNY